MELDQLISLMRICRGCLATKRKMYNLEPYVDAFHDLMDITISPSDGLPQVVCCDCADLLRKYRRFRRQVINSHEQLLKHVKKDKQDEKLTVEVEDKSETTPQTKRESVIVQTHTDVSHEYEEEWYEDYDPNHLTSEITTSNENTDLKENQVSADPEMVPSAPEPERHLVPTWRHLYDHTYIKLAPQLEDNGEDDIVKNNNDNSNTDTLIYQCKICNETFNDKILLISHAEKHSNDKTYICIQCKKSFKHEGFFIRHLRVHTSERPHKCKKCLKTFKCETKFNKHKCVFIGIKPYKCEACSKCFKTKINFNKHVLKHSGRKPRKCDYCLKTFYSKEDLIKHIRLHVSSRPYVCDVCKKCYIQSSHLCRHYRTHTGEKPYQCDRCPVGFTDKYRFDIHLRRHAGIKPYSCDICKNRFTQKNHLNVHYRTHTGVKPYKCVCGQRFKDKKAFARHKHKHCLGKNNENDD